MSENPGLRYGMLGGLAVVLYFLVLYTAGTAQFMHIGLQWSSMLIYLVFMYLASVEDCRKRGLQRDIRELIRTPFVAFLLINLAYWLFYYGIHLYDPSLISAELLMEKERLEAEIRAGLGDPSTANQYRERIGQISGLIDSPGTQPLGPIITRMCVGAIGGFILAAAIALYLRYRK
jgi:Protein of unknown function (DUF4199)